MLRTALLAHPFAACHVLLAKELVVGLDDPCELPDARRRRHLQDADPPAPDCRLADVGAACQRAAGILASRHHVVEHGQEPRRLADTGEPGSRRCREASHAGLAAPSRQARSGLIARLQRRPAAPCGAARTPHSAMNASARRLAARSDARQQREPRIQPVEPRPQRASEPRSTAASRNKTVRRPPHRCASLHPCSSYAQEHAPMPRPSPDMAKKEARDQAIGASRGGRTTKIRIVDDLVGRPIVLHLAPGQHADIGVAPALVEPAGPFRRLIANRAQDADSLREAMHRALAKAAMPVCSNPIKLIRHAKKRHRELWRVEAAIGWLNDFRRGVTGCGERPEPSSTLGNSPLAACSGCH